MTTSKNNTLEKTTKTLITTKVDRGTVFTAFHEQFPAQGLFAVIRYNYNYMPVNKDRRQAVVCVHLLAVAVITPQFPTCFSSRPVTVHTTKRTTTTPSGYLASVITEKTQCGATDRPWLLDAAPGQQINFTLYNFGAVAARKTSVATETHCRVYAIIKDVDDGKSVTVCAGTKRIRMVYVSSSHVVEVRLLPGNANSTGYFLLHYQGQDLLSSYVLINE